MQGVPEQGGQQPPDGHQRLVPVGNAALPTVRDPYAAPGYPRGTYDDGNELAASLQQYLRMFVKRRWLIAGLTLLFVALAAIYTLMRTPLYTATVRIQIDSQSVKIVEGGATSPNDGASLDFLRTQYELLKSRAMAERVVSAVQPQDDK